MRQIFDITQTTSAKTVVIPGDAPLTIHWSDRMEQGGGANVSAWTQSPHLGTHMDASLHVDAAGGDVTEIPLEAVMGECWVVDVRSEMPGAREIGLEVLTRLPQTLQRVLFKTRTTPLERWEEPTAYLSPALVEALLTRGAQLIGIDAFGIDPYDSPDLRGHHVALSAGVVLLENLDLRAVPEGRYELFAFPLKIAGLEASPVRAILREY